MACSKARVFGLGIGEAHDLVAPLALPPPPVRHVDFGFIAPQPHQLLDRGAQRIGIDVVAPVAEVRHEDEARGLQQRIVPLPVAAERTRERHCADQFDIHERGHVLVRHIDELSREFACCISGQDDRAGDRRARLGIGRQRRLDHRGFGAVDADDGERIADPVGLGPRLRDGNIGLARQAEQHGGPAGDLDPRDVERVLPVVPRRDEHGQAGAVNRTHGRSREVGRALLLAHGHAMRDLEIVAVVGCSFVAAEEHAGGGDVVGHGEGLGLGRAAHAALERHHVEERLRGGARLVAAQLVHRGEHGADALALDRAGEHEIDADALGSQLERQLARPCVHRRLGHDIGRPRIIGRAREDRRDVDDRAAFAHRRSGGARQIPRHAEDVAHRRAHGFGVGRTFLLQRCQLIGIEGQLLDGLLGAR